MVREWVFRAGLMMGLLVLSACGGKVNIDENKLMYGQESPVGASRPVATVSVLNASILKFNDIAQDLQKTQFNPTWSQLLTAAVTTTSATNNAIADQLSGNAAATVAGSSLDDTTETSATAAGTTRTRDRKVSRKTPDAPDYGTFTLKTPDVVTGGPSGGAASVEAQTQYETAAALAEEVAILNKRVSGLALQRGYTPYFMSFQIGVVAGAHGLPYDATVHLQLGSVTSSLAGHKDPGPAIAQLTSAQASTGCATGSEVTVLPLLVTDALESTSEVDASDIVRQFGLAIKGSGGLFGGSGRLERALTRINQSQALRLNSLLSVTREGQSCIAVRIGANRYGNAFEMSTHNRNVSLVVLVPESSVRDTDWFAKAGPATPVVPISGTAEFHDPVWYLAGRPYPDPTPVVVIGDMVPLPVAETPRCPPLQDALLTAGDSADQAAVTLGAGQGLDLSHMTARLRTPNTIANRSLEFVSRQAAAPEPGELRFTFPAQGSLFRGTKSAAVATGYLRFTVYTDGVLRSGTLANGAHGFHCPDEWTGEDSKPSDTTAYRVSYVIAAAAPAPAPKKVVPAPGPASPTPAPAAAPAAGTPTSVTPAPANPSTPATANLGQPAAGTNRLEALAPRVTLPM